MILIYLLIVRAIMAGRAGNPSGIYSLLKVFLMDSCCSRGRQPY